jgi:hypothetical protein
MKNYGNNLDYSFCYKEAKKYNTLKEFRKGSQSSYIKSLKMGWLNDFSWLIKIPKIKWDEESSYQEALKYTTKKDFREKSIGAYKASKRNGWLNNYTWLKTTSIDESLQFKKIWIVYSYELIDINYVYVGLTRNIHERDLCHKSDKSDPLFKFCSENSLCVPEPKILISDLLPEEAQEKEDYYLIYYKNNGWNIINRGKTGKGSGSLGYGIIKWNENSCLSLAKTCSSISEFKKKSPRAYEVSRKRGWIKDYYWFESKVGSTKKKVGQFTLSGNLIREFDSISDAARYIGKSGSRSKISMVCLWKRQTAFGYSWKYL